jgi:hypothetical protein
MQDAGASWSSQLGGYDLIPTDRRFHPNREAAVLFTRGGLLALGQTRGETTMIVIAIRSFVLGVRSAFPSCR